MGFNKAHKMAQRLHRERKQPEYRKKFGYLEKKQDYKKRALDHHSKAERLKKLKNKAQERNPNEFNLHMINSRLIDGVHHETLKPMEPTIRQNIVKKENLLQRYNTQILMRRKARRNPRGVPTDDEEQKPVATKKSKSKIPKHIIFNKE